MFMVALPPAEPPARVVAGVTVTWPLSRSETESAPGTKLTVRVTSKRRRAKLAFVRVNADGKGLATVAKRTLRRGSFTVKVPSATPGARYALRLTVAGRKRFSWVTTPVPPPVDTTLPRPIDTQLPSPTPIPFCGPTNPSQHESEINATVTPAATTVRAGDVLGYAVTNTGPGVFTASGVVALVPDGETAPFESPSTSLLQRLAIGESAQLTLTVPADTAPGSYRVSPAVSYVSCDVIGSKRFVSAPIEVTAP